MRHHETRHGFGASNTDTCIGRWGPAQRKKMTVTIDCSLHARGANQQATGHVPAHSPDRLATGAQGTSSPQSYAWTATAEQAPRSRAAGRRCHELASSSQPHPLLQASTAAAAAAAHTARVVAVAASGAPVGQRSAPAAAAAAVAAAAAAAPRMKWAGCWGWGGRSRPGRLLRHWGVLRSAPSLFQVVPAATRRGAVKVASDHVRRENQSLDDA